MKKLLIVLLLLPLAVAGCVIEPVRGYGGRDYRDSHEDRGQRGEHHGDRDRR